MANKLNIIASNFKPVGYESLTISTAAVQLTVANYTDSNGELAKQAIITIEDAQLRWRVDGTDPTASEGHLQNPFDVIVLKGTQNIQNFSTIRKGSTDATIRVTYSL